MFKFRVIISITCLLLPFINYGQFNPPQNWVHFDKQLDGFYGIASDKAYNELLKDKASRTVIVAILDTGVDAEHEDLAGNIWLNYDEIPGNGIDDDKNGYIDDVNGWNFIGGNAGDVQYETYEVTRLYAAMKNKYEHAELESLTTAEKKEYSKFVRYKEEVEKKRKSAQRNFDQINSAKQAYNDALLSVKDALDTSFVSKDDLTKIPGTSQDQLIGRNILKDIMKNDMTSMDIDTLLKYINSELNAELEQHEIKLNYSYNPNWDSRKIVGDNDNDLHERIYGNSNVEGPDALHGTHVAGTIGAIRDNKIGMNGIVQNVKLMSVRMLPPNGDERDKDIANAIRYAVDNGASIINMSFGKGHSPNKKIVDEAVRYAQKHDVLLVHASGNGSLDNDVEKNYPNDQFEDPKGFLFWKEREAKNWIEVGALNHMPEEYLIAPFSNYGATNVDLFAPGMAIYATVPNDKYAFLNGTSMASPVVAGAAAVLRSYFPTLDAFQIKDILMKSVTKVNTEVLLPGYADKKVSFNELCVSGGILNLYEAIKLAQRTKGNKKLKSDDNKV